MTAKLDRHRGRRSAKVRVERAREREELGSQSQGRAGARGEDEATESARVQGRQELHDHLGSRARGHATRRLVAREHADVHVMPSPVQRSEALAGSCEERFVVLLHDHDVLDVPDVAGPLTAMLHHDERDGCHNGGASAWYVPPERARLAPVCCARSVVRAQPQLS